MGSKTQTLLRPLPRPSLLRDNFNGTSIRVAQFTAANSERLSCADASFLTTGDVDWVFSCWFYSDSDGDHNLLGKGTAGQYEFQAYRKNADGKLRTEILDAAGSSIGTVDSAALVSNAAWHHLVFYHDSVGNLVGQALDGATYRTAATSGSPVDGTAAFTIGALNTASQFWDGRITRACWFKTPTGVAALASTIATRLYNSGTPLNFSDLTSAEKTAWGLVAGSGEWWQLDEPSIGTGAVTRVGSVNAVNLTDNNTVQSKSFSKAYSGVNQGIWTLTDTVAQAHVVSGNPGKLWLGTITGGGGWGDPAIQSIKQFARKAGRTIDVEVYRTSGSLNQIGWMATSGPTSFSWSELGIDGAGSMIFNQNGSGISNAALGGSLSNAQRQYRFVLLDTGGLIYARGSGITGYTSLTGPWALVYHDSTANHATLTVGADAAGNLEQLKVNSIRVYDRAAPTPVVSDTFTRADSASSLGSAETGQAWSAVTGTWGISSNRAYSASNTTVDLALVDAGIADGVVECVTNGTLLSATDYSVPSVVFRGIDVSNYLLVQMNASTIYLLKRDAGSGSTLASAATTTADATDYTIRVVLVGTSVQVYVGNTRLINHTLAGGDATKFLSTTKIGMRLDKGGAPATPAKWDDLRFWGGLPS